MSFPVVWLEAHPLCWDQAWVDEALTALGGCHVVGFDALPESETGAVVVVPARYYERKATWLNNQLGNLDWAVVILTSDEESLFPKAALKHDNMATWVMTPKPGKHHPPARFIGHGCPPDTAPLLAERSTPDTPRDLDWSFAGQVNHRRREAAVAAMTGMEGGELHPSGGFTQGLDRPTYLNLLARSKASPSPSGPATPDCFRVWEALTAGCVPIVDAVCPKYRDDYWGLLLGEQPPFPVLADWEKLPYAVEEVVASWPASGNRAWAWWQHHQARKLAALAADIDQVAGAGTATMPGGDVTVLIPTSPIPTHPSTVVIEDTVASVRYWLPDAQIVVMFDGVRPEQEHRRAVYEDYQRAVLWHCQHDWGRCTPLRFEDHHHQANMTRVALQEVSTPLVLFVEHDTPLVVDCPIDWDGIRRVLLDNRLDVVRFHHEAHILDAHQHLMIDQDGPKNIGGVPFRRTSQWSQRPHLARADYYRRVIGNHFPPSANTMIEDKMHSVCQDQSWHLNRLAVYAPPGNLKRSLHSDGRGDDPKYEMRYE